jgi:hypothetical protein
MGLKILFATVFAVLFTPGSFWRDLKNGDLSQNPLKDYSLPVIAVVQLCKFPVIGVPRTAMMFSLVSFIVDVSVVYLLAGAIVYLIDREQPEAVQQRVLILLSYALTPVWLIEPFYFAGGWSWFFAAAALSYALVIGKSGMSVLLEEEVGRFEWLPARTAVLFIMVNTASYLLIRGLIRFFNI